MVSLKNYKFFYMIIGISDGVGMTSKVCSLKTQKQALCHYEKFYTRHYNVLKDKWGKCSWEIVKTTGDGLFFYSKDTQLINCGNCLNSIIDLHKIIDDIEQRSRVFLYYCDRSKVVFGEKMNGDAIKSFLGKDMFGDQLNFGFRLLGLASGPVLFTEERFLEKIYPNEANNKIKFKRDGIEFVPIPVTYLKGIDYIGFRSRNAGKVGPHWIWEIKY